MLKLVALYICKMGSKTRTYKIADLIAKESSDS